MPILSCSGITTSSLLINFLLCLITTIHPSLAIVMLLFFANTFLAFFSWAKLDGTGGLVASECVKQCSSVWAWSMLSSWIELGLAAANSWIELCLICLRLSPPVNLQTQVKSGWSEISLWLTYVTLLSFYIRIYMISLGQKVIFDVLKKIKVVKIACNCQTYIKSSSIQIQTMLT